MRGLAALYRPGAARHNLPRGKPRWVGRPFRRSWLASTWSVLGPLFDGPNALNRAVLQSESAPNLASCAAAVADGTCSKAAGAGLHCDITAHGLRGGSEPPVGEVAACRRRESVPAYASHELECPTSRSGIVTSLRHYRQPRRPPPTHAKAAERLISRSTSIVRHPRRAPPSHADRHGDHSSPRRSPGRDHEWGDASVASLTRLPALFSHVGAASDPADLPGGTADGSADFARIAQCMTRCTSSIIAMLRHI